MQSPAAKMFVGGDPSLDFLNTAGGRTKARDVERLNSYVDAVAWATAIGLITETEAQDLTDAAAIDPAHAGRHLSELRQQRETLHSFLSAALEGGSPTERDRRTVESTIRAARGRAILEIGQAVRSCWKIEFLVSGLGLISDRIALSIDSLITSPSMENLQICEACSWMFLATRGTKTRRWCSMAACGNRAKARRHYEKVCDR